MEVAARDPWKRLLELERAARVVHADILETIDRLEQEWPEDTSVPDLSVELAHHLGWSQNGAYERLRIAEALRGLPHLRRAAAAGELSESQLRWVVPSPRPRPTSSGRAGPRG